MASNAQNAQDTSSHEQVRTEYAQDARTGAGTDAPEETHTHELGRILISPPEGFDAYQAAHGHDEHEEHEHIHIPPPSFIPFLVAGAVTLLFTGFLAGPLFVIVGTLGLIGLIIAWGIEGAQDGQTALTDVRVLDARSATDALTQGAVVLTADGRSIGRVSRASENSPLVRAGWIPTRHGYLARKFIDHIEEGMIVLTLTEDEVRSRANVTTTPAAPGAGSLSLPTANPTPARPVGAIAARSESEG